MTDTEIRSCEDALRVLAAYLDGELDARVHNQVGHHLETCRSCYSRADFERRLKEMIASSARDAVRPELRTRIRTLIGQFADEEPGAAGPGEPGPGGAGRD